jgi:hypothetical protein
MIFIWCAYGQVSQKIKIIFWRKKKNTWYDLTFFYIHKN